MHSVVFHYTLLTSHLYSRSMGSHSEVLQDFGSVTHWLQGERGGNERSTMILARPHRHRERDNTHRQTYICMYTHTPRTRILLDLVEIFWRILVGHVGRTDVQFEVRAEIFKVVIIGEICNEKRVKGEVCNG